jgi:hypothetical protein
MFENALSDPVFLALAGIVVLFILVVYLFVRRTLLGLREGFEEGRR